MHFQKFSGRGGKKGLQHNPKSLLVSLGCIQKNGLTEFLQGKQPLPSTHLLPSMRQRAQHTELCQGAFCAKTTIGIRWKQAKAGRQHCPFECSQDTATTTETPSVLPA